MPQAFVLTAIVISMATTLYLLAGIAATARRGLCHDVEPAPESDGERAAGEVLAELEGRGARPMTLAAAFLLPGVGAMVLWLWRPAAPVSRRATIALAALLLLLALRLLVLAGQGEIAVHGFGSWRPPYGVVFAVDRLSALFIALHAALLLLSVVILRGSAHGEDAVRRAHPLLMLATMGLVGAFATGDLFNLFVMFELVLVCSYVLLQVPGSERSVAAALPVVVINLVASLLFLAGLGLLYGICGSLNLADLMAQLSGGPGATAPGGPGHARRRLRHQGVAGASLLLDAGHLSHAQRTRGRALRRHHDEARRLCPAAHPAPAADGRPAARDPGLGGGALGTARCARGALPVRAAAPARLPQRLPGGLHGPGSRPREYAAGIAGAIFFALHHSLVKSALYFVADELERRNASRDLRAMHPGRLGSALLAPCFGVAAFALAGLPPFSGFFGKLAVFRAGIVGRALGRHGPAAGGIGVHPGQHAEDLAASPSIRGPGNAGAEPRPGLAQPRGLLTAAALVLALGFAAGPVYRYAEAAAAELVDPHTLPRGRARGRGASAPGPAALGQRPALMSTFFYMLLAGAVWMALRQSIDWQTFLVGAAIGLVVGRAFGAPARPALHALAGLALRLGSLWGCSRSSSGSC